MTLFEKIAASDLKCEVCGSDTVAVYGCDWENDIIHCSDANCSAEYIFPTSTTKDED